MHSTESAQLDKVEIRQSVQSSLNMRGVRWFLALLVLALLSAAQDESGDGEASEDAPPEEEAPAAEEGEEGADGEEPAEAEEEGGEEESSGGEKKPSEGGDEECETEETEGEGSGDEIGDILALGGEKKKCKSKDKKDEEGSGSGDAEGADALAAAVGATTCNKEGMDPKVAECLGGLETKVNELMTAIMGPDGGGGTLEDKITLVLVKKGVISCENEEQCDMDKQCLKQPDGMSRCQNPCERPDIIRYQFRTHKKFKNL